MGQPRSIRSGVERTSILYDNGLRRSELCNLIRLVPAFQSRSVSLPYLFGTMVPCLVQPTVYGTSHTYSLSMAQRDIIAVAYVTLHAENNILKIINGLPRTLLQQHIALGMIWVGLSRSLLCFSSLTCSMTLICR